MAGKRFPPKTEKEVWNTAHQDTLSGSRGVTISGSLKYTAESSTKLQPPSEPLFQLRLRPLKLDYSHRLQRRFGNDRFLEIDIPSFSGNKIPKRIQDLGPRAKTILVTWLRCRQELLGRTWVSFCNKPDKSSRSKNRGKKKNPAVAIAVDNAMAHKIYFFAVDGIAFLDNRGTPLLSETTLTRTQWTVEGLLNWLRPTQQNKDQPYLKLYARTTLGNFCALFNQRHTDSYRFITEYCSSDAQSRPDKFQI